MAKHKELTLHEYVKKKIQAKGLTDIEATKAIGVNESAITKLKTQKPSVRTLRKISDFLGVSIATLMNKPITRRKESK